jgi:hypothetical protein
MSATEVMMPPQADTFTAGELNRNKKTRPPTGLPDFTWYNRPKQEKYTKLPQTIPNDHKIYQIGVKYSK